MVFGIKVRWGRNRNCCIWIQIKTEVGGVHCCEFCLEEWLGEIDKGGKFVDGCNYVKLGGPFVLVQAIYPVVGNFDVETCLDYDGVG